MEALLPGPLAEHHDAFPLDLRRRLVATEMVIDSIEKVGSVKRLVHTSSFAAAGHPAPEGVYTEDSSADMNKESRREGSEWTLATVVRGPRSPTP